MTAGSTMEYPLFQSSPHTVRPESFHSCPKRRRGVYTMYCAKLIHAAVILLFSSSVADADVSRTPAPPNSGWRPTPPPGGAVVRAPQNDDAPLANPYCKDEDLVLVNGDVAKRGFFAPFKRQWKPPSLGRRNLSKSSTDGQAAPDSFKEIQGGATTSNHFRDAAGSVSSLVAALHPRLLAVVGFAALLKLAWSKRQLDNSTEAPNADAAAFSAASLDEAPAPLPEDSDTVEDTDSGMGIRMGDETVLWQERCAQLREESAALRAQLHASRAELATANETAAYWQGQARDHERQLHAAVAHQVSTSQDQMRRLQQAMVEALADERALLMAEFHAAAAQLRASIVPS